MKKNYLISAVAVIAVATVVGISAKNILSKSAVSSKQVQSTAANTDSSFPIVNVYKFETCGCCSEWVKHLENNGFQVESHNVNNLLPYKDQAKIGASMGSCHTAFVGDYAIEGHVPAQDIKRLLQSKPDITGLAVPGMPTGSPGMEAPGYPTEAYDVISYKDGQAVGVFSQYPVTQ